MKLKTGILVIFLVIGLLGVPNCIFAQDNSFSSNAIFNSGLPIMSHINGLNPEVRGGGGSKVGFTSVSKSAKKADIGDAASAVGDFWWIILVIIVIIVIIAILVWYFYLRK